MCYFNFDLDGLINARPLIAPSRAVATMLVFEELMFVNRAALAVALETLIAL